MNKSHHQLIIILFIFLAATIACNTVTGVGERIGETRNTAEAAATEISRGVDMLATARAIGTEVGGSALIETAQALATEMGESSFLKTAQAYATAEGPALLQTMEGIATDQGPALMETAQAFATEDVSGYIETAQAYATEEGPKLLETAQAYATEAAANLGEPPDDIPLVEGERNQFYAIEKLVFYLTPLPYTDVLGFYKTQMPLNGWTYTQQGSVDADSAAILMFEKESRRASIALSINPVDQQTVVLVTILDP